MKATPTHAMKGLLGVTTAKRGHERSEARSESGVAPGGMA